MKWKGSIRVEHWNLAIVNNPKMDTTSKPSRKLGTKGGSRSSSSSSNEGDGTSTPSESDDKSKAKPKGKGKERAAEEPSIEPLKADLFYMEMFTVNEEQCETIEEAAARFKEFFPGLVSTFALSK